MKKVLVLVSLLFACLVHVEYSSAKPGIKAIVGGTLVGVGEQSSIEDSTILIHGSMIIKTGGKEDIEIPPDADIISAHGKWIIPGLIDSHIHFFQSGGLYTRPDIIDLRQIRPYDDELNWIKESLRDTFTRYIRSGVTSVVDMGGPTWTFEARETANSTFLAPRVAAAGPLISTYQPEEIAADPPPIIVAHSPDEARSLVKAQLPYSPDLVKFWFIVLPGHSAREYLPILKAVVEESHKNWIRVAVHATELETARTAIEAGADILVHSVRDRAVDNAFVQALKRKGILYIPTLMVSMRYEEVLSQQLNLTPQEQELANPYILSSLSDLLRLPESAVPRRALSRIRNPEPISPNPIELRNLLILSDAGVRIAAGTDAGNIGTPHGPAIFRELQLMAEAGLTPHEILTAATLTGARVLGRQKTVGSLEPGKLADMVILDADPTASIMNTAHIHRVIKDGVVFSPEDL